ncbi:MAG: sensor histidine kinase [Thermoplasmatota archaeon]
MSVASEPGQAGMTALVGLVEGGRVVWLEGAARRWLGVGANEVVGQSVPAVLGASAMGQLEAWRLAPRDEPFPASVGGRQASLAFAAAERGVTFLVQEGSRGWPEALSASALAVLGEDRDGTIRWASPAAATLLGTSPSACVGRRLEELDGPGLPASPSTGVLRLVSQATAKVPAERLRILASREAREGRFQRALTQIAREALKATRPAAIFEATVEVVASSLGSDTALVQELVAGRELVVRAQVGPGANAVGERRRLEAGSATSYALSAGGPVVLEDATTETRFKPDGAGGMGVLVAIPGRVGAWGVLSTYAHSRLPYAPADISFVQTAAHVLGAALERLQADEAMRSAAARLAVRERQQATVAELGRKALAGEPLEALFRDATSQVAAVLKNEFASLLRLHTDDHFDMVASVGWGPERTRVRIPAGAGSQAGYTLAQRRPVILCDAATESRFAITPPMQAEGVQSGMSVVVEGRPGASWGVLSTHARRRVDYSADDAAFVQAVANVLAAAVERDRVEGSLRHANAELQELDQKRTDFMNLVAHELRTPLTPLMMRLQMMRDGSIPPADADNLRTLERNMERLCDLVDHLLELTRFESTSVGAWPWRPVDLAEEIEHAAETFRASAEGRGLTLSTYSVGNLRLEAEPQRVMQILTNLLANAMKFTPDRGSIRVSGRAENREEPGVLVEVTDTGEGFTADQAAHLFRRFSQPHGSERGGYGLGLYISRAIAQRHGGTLEATSPGPGLGATFRLWLPRRPPGLA